MFTLLKLLISAAVLVAVAGGVFYFLPGGVKTDALEKISGIVPETIKEKVEDLTLTPPEKREQIIDELTEKLIILKASANETDLPLIEEAEALIEKLKEKNEEASLTEIAKVKIVESLLNKEKQVCPVEEESTQP